MDVPSFVENGIKWCRWFIDNVTPMQGNENINDNTSRNSTDCNERGFDVQFFSIMHFKDGGPKLTVNIVFYISNVYQKGKNGGEM
jgi:uncharacterized protein YodC (DUF2158 family)